jgi:predicted phage terminase large subunit-like protein
VVARFDRGEPAAISTGDDARRRGHRSGRHVREQADETGIVVAGKDKNGHGYVLADISGRYPPTEWARLAITAYRTHRADRIVAEVNNGGDMVEATLRMVDPNVPFTAVRASRGKVVRAEPVAALYQQGRVHHIGTFPQLEDQMTNFTSDIDRAAAGYSPDRVDALVWAFSELLVQPMESAGIYELYRRQAEAAAARGSHSGKRVPDLTPGRSRVRLRAPPGIGSVQTFSGRRADVDLDGTIEMSAEDAQFYIRDGWIELAE